MHLHQVLTGAVNPGDSCYSVGSVNDIPFTAYGSGCDIVILASDFECVQIIPGAQNGNIQVGCVECSHQLGRIAASYGNTVCIFEPIITNPNKRHKQLNYQWQKTGQFFLNAMTYNLAWDPQGNRILAATERLQLWAPPSCDTLVEEEDSQLADDKPHPVLNDWKCVWQCKTAAAVHITKWSPDGEYFATAGKDDCLLKVWYPTTGWKSAVVIPEVPDKKAPSVHFSFVYLAHPRTVTGFSWRKTSKYMPKGSVCNVLLTACADGICRLWSETLLPEDSLLGGQISENSTSFSSSLPHMGGKDKIQHALESIHHLKHLRRGRRRSSALVAHTELLPSQMGSHEVHRHISHHANALCHFHISASINPNTDIPIALAGSLFSTDEPNGGFVVHWLNNKDLSFTTSMDLFMQQLRKLSEQQLEHGGEDIDPEGSPMKFDFEVDEMSDKALSEHGEEGEQEGSTKASSPGSSSSVPLPTMLLDRKMETLTLEWNKSPDMLFTIHPVDGSFLVWHIKYLDEFIPGIFRQVQVTFSSRIPVAFPTGDANSLSKNIMMYACTPSEVDSGAELDQKRSGRHGPPRSASVSLGASALAAPPSRSLAVVGPAVMMVSKHVDGSLNQWAVSFAEKSAFASVLTVSHKFRYCGHRFHLNGLACHTVLPLLLTSSHHNALLTPPPPAEAERAWPDHEGDEEGGGGGGGGGRAGRGSLKGFPRKQLRNAATRTFHDPNAIYSELILWRVDHIGPLSCTGGVSELARINSLHTSAFSNVAWLPTLVPSSVLGTYCNSASACFVASDGKNLRLYQAVVDARKLLDELSDPETSKLVGETFNIVSQQSTARPGCIIELDVITNQVRNTSQCGSNTQLLHVFQEDFILGYKPHDDAPDFSTFPSSEEYQAPPFSEKFFLVVIEKDEQHNSFVQMWHLHLKSVQACVDEPVVPDVFQNQLMVPQTAGNAESSPETSPGQSPLPRSSSSANLQSASKLILSSRLVYSQRLELPTGVEIIRATPSAGHLSSSSIYPVCLAPYLIVTTCSDGRVRFWRCAVDVDLTLAPSTPESESACSYRWEPWSLLNEEEDNNSAVGVPGRPVAVSCSYTGRLAVSFKQPSAAPGSRDFSMHVSIYECESTGGSEWVLEQTLHLEDVARPAEALDPCVSVDSNLFVYSRSDLFLHKDSPNIKHFVHLDWLSKEDGSHILTVGVGSSILMYGRISGMINEPTGGKEGMAVIALPLGGSIKQGVRSRWVLLRSVALVSSVDGTPSLPVSLSWVRDGILVVGMDCEMHVYAQWRQDKKPGESEGGSLCSAEDIAAATTRPTPTEGRGRSKSVFETGAMDDIFRAPPVLQDGGLFEAAHSLSPTLPQYHPTQLLELMDLGKVRRAKAILSHLVKCIAGEVAVVRDVEAGEGGGRRHLSRTISVSGSTAKDTIVAGREGARDYTEINSIPPLPLYALLSADLDTSYKAGEEAGKGPKEAEARKPGEDQYADLFQAPGVSTDDYVSFAAEKPEKKSRFINLSQYGPTYFGPEHAQVLSSQLMHSSLPGLTRLEQMFLVALADTVATTSAEVGTADTQYTGGEALDECGLRYLLAMRLHTCLLTSLPPLYRMQLQHQGVSTCHFAWAFHSEAEEEMLNMIPAMQKGDPQWSELRAVGVGWWIRNINTLRRMVEKVGKAAFQRNNDPLDAALFYLAMKKKAVLWGLFRSQHDEKMTQFFSHNFSEDRWRKAALKNAFSLLGKQRFEQSAAFFLLAGSLKDAIEVCLEKMEDIQLAMIVARLYEADYESSSTCQGILYEKVLGCKRDGSAFSCRKLSPDPFLRSIAFWIMKDYTRALDTLLEQIPKEDDENPEVMVKSCNPVVFSFYNYLRTHPLIIRRHFASPEGVPATVGLTAEKSSADEINLIERKLFFTTANAHFKVGCPVLALEVLSKIPKVTKKVGGGGGSGGGSVSKGSSVANVSSAVENGGRAGDLDWGTAAPAWGSATTTTAADSSSLMDWGQPVVKAEDDDLKLDWGEDKAEDDEDDEDDDDGGLTMKKPEVAAAVEEKRKASRPSGKVGSLQREDSAGEGEVDVIAEQLKFRACLKILMTELRTLATGYEVDGGKLRFQLYNWLEKEIEAMHHICNYKAEGQEGVTATGASSSSTSSAVEKWTDTGAEASLDPGEDAGPYERHLVERRRLQAKQQHAERRKAWLRKNQALLRIFLSYCSLHGAKGGGVTSVRMELLFLLQESQQETTVKQLQSPLPLPTTLPLLSASIAPTKTVISNPVLHLNNHIHDILYTIVQMEAPPHPDTIDDRVNMLHTLAASLSACIYQALCDSHSYSSQTEANQFTGMVYQGLLLSERRRLRTESIEEHATPTSAPAQWPGVSSLISLVLSAQGEEQPRLNVMLCEAVVAVYLSLLIHGMGTHSGNELFRLAAHPLNNRMWAAIFGGGAKVIIKPKRPSESPALPPPTPPAEDVDRHRRRFNMRMLVPGRPVKETPPATPPPVPVERPTYKEKFIPPELSMWDYFVAKPFLPPSDSGALYDSDESGVSDDDDDDDAFLSDTQMTEHSDPNSYSWALIRMVMVKLALHNVKTFLPLTGLDFTDLPVVSPLCNAVMKTLENWEQVLLDKMNRFDGPPPSYINTYPTDMSAGGGPAILRHKAMLEPDNTPFKAKHHLSFPVRRLWHYLVKQEALQETLIRYIFTKKRKQSESLDGHAERLNRNCVAGARSGSKVEADLGYPGGKAKIVHKESDIIMAFAINKANMNEIVLASTHDVQEVDVSTLLAAQPFTWIGEDFDKESRSSDDVDYRSSHTNIAQASSAAVPISASASMPWLGSGQTSMGASVIMKRNLNNVKRMTSHPIYQYYMTGAQDGSVRMFEWNRPQQLICFRQAGNARVTRLYFNSQGNKCGVADGEGFLSLWQVNQTSSNPKPYLSWQCHTKTCGDFAFITSSSLIATAGQSNDSRNLCLWDTLISPSNTMVHAFPCHDNGATVLQYAPKQQLIISGGRKGCVCIFDIRQRQLLHTFQAHDSAIKALAMDPSEDFFVTGSAEGNMKVWKLTGHGLMHSFSTEHAKQSIFRNIGAGVMQIETCPGNRIFTCGADGTLKMRVLPDRYNIPASIFDIL
ncbi:dmX-like protein 2 isoform X1 [Sardina pilchardus]|uniref:dmX-like protein 2 isoform X1 n=1 Tax=Sardina pilchardus TaxID=27697 RepID=UPI002E0FF8DF